MENLKIRVTTEQESKEAQELFFELGYYWAYRKIGKKFYYKDGDVFIFAESDGILGAGVIEHAYFFNSHKAKEITLPQLRDMVKPKVKEYLTKNSSGNYQLVNHRFNGDDIEVPEGAEILTAILGDEVFYKSGEPWEWYCEEFKKWMECSDIVGLDGFRDILWQRSLNDKVASAEVARQELKGVDATLADRQSTYGSFEDVSSVTQDLLSILKRTGYESLPKPHKEALHMICSKMARIVNGDSNHLDSWHDIGGYAKLIEDLIGEAS